MAEKSDDDSDHGDDLNNTSIVKQIKRLEREKAELEKRQSERNLLQEKLKELQGSVSALKSGPSNDSLLKSPTKSPGTSGRGKGKGKKNSPGSHLTSALDAEFLKLAQSSDNRRTRSKTSRTRAGESDSDEDSEDSEVEKECVMTAGHKQQLQQNRDTLVESMLPDDIFNDLIANRILTTADVSRIKEKNTREAINEELLNNLIRRSDRGFAVFVESLRKTLQGYLADLVDDRPKQKKRKRKRASGEMSVSVDVDEVIPRTKRKPPACTCQQVEEQMLQMAKNAYAKIRRRDDSPASFEQFKKELGQTNTIIKDSMEIMHTLKILCRHGDIEEVTYGSVKFQIRFTSVKKLTNLWRLYRSGKLLDIFQSGFVTKHILKHFNVRHIKLGLRIQEEEYLQCLRKLGGSDIKHPGKAKSKYTRVAELQENIIPEDRLSPQASPLSIYKDHRIDTPTSTYELSLSDPGPKRFFREIHKNVANSMSSIHSRTLPLTPKLTMRTEKLVLSRSSIPPLTPNIPPLTPANKSSPLHSHQGSPMLVPPSCVVYNTRLRSHLQQDSRQRNSTERI